MHNSHLLIAFSDKKWLRCYVCWHRTGLSLTIPVGWITSPASIFEYPPFPFLALPE
ncbi:hypothetical protein [Bartonella sp. CB60]|uniref:hypothetical protein n=1 Tax=Bartonella sp. CB60 TaxID=3113619 RepID=UPI00300E218C